MIVFCAEITMTGRPGRCSPIFGSASSPLPSGMTTSEMTRSPLPSSTQRISVTSEEVACTLQPARVSAWVRTVRIVRSSSATRTVPSIRGSPQRLRPVLARRAARCGTPCVPAPSSTEIQPSCSEMILETSARPSPVPFSRPETKGSKISLAISGGMPGPSSMISTCSGRVRLAAVLAPHAAATGRRRCASRIVPPLLPAASAAFLSRFMEHLEHLVAVAPGWAAARGRNPRRIACGRRSPPSRTCAPGRAGRGR